MKKILFLGYALVLIGCNTSSPKDELHEIITTYENYGKDKKEETPLGVYTEARFEAYAKFCDSLKTVLEEIDPNKLSDDDRISHTLLHFVLNETVVKYDFKTHWNPILSDAGFHSSLTYRVRPITNKKSALAYLELLKAIPEYFEQQSVLIKKGLDAGMGQPLVIFKGYESTYEQHITDTAEENFYYSPFLKLPPQLTSTEKDSLRQAS